jgi:hypothetical protein
MSCENYRLATRRASAAKSCALRGFPALWQLRRGSPSVGDASRQGRQEREDKILRMI